MAERAAKATRQADPSAAEDPPVRADPFGPWPALAAPESRALIEAAAATDPHDPAGLTRLRRLAPPDRVRAAIELVRARRKAAAKLPHPDRLLADPAGVEQASSHPAATHKARRFAEAGLDDVLDLCCGIGGDAIALAGRGGAAGSGGAAGRGGAAGSAGAAGRGGAVDVTLLDASPERVWLARHNVRELTGRTCPAAAADVTAIDLAGRAFHLDPDRRAHGRRLHRYEDLRPGPSFIKRAVRQARAGAVKLSPAVDLDALPPGNVAGEIEILNERGTLTQAILWTGALAGPNRRTATRLPEGVSLSGEGDDDPAALPLAKEMGRYLLAVDPAVERTRLTGQLCRQLDLAAVHPKLGLLTADTPPSSPWLTPFELLETMPWRPKRVRRWLAAHDAGPVEVKTRGKAVDPDAAQKQLRGPGDTPYAVFVLRFEQKRQALITRRA